eukprot:1158092-Pelagomonas_calceolata.AAC.8
MYQESKWLRVLLENSAQPSTALGSAGARHWGDEKPKTGSKAGTSRSSAKERQKGDSTYEQSPCSAPHSLHRKKPAAAVHGCNACVQRYATIESSCTAKSRKARHGGELHEVVDASPKQKRAQQPAFRTSSQHANGRCLSKTGVCRAAGKTSRRL